MTDWAHEQASRLVRELSGVSTERKVERIAEVLRERRDAMSDDKPSHRVVCQSNSQPDDTIRRGYPNGRVEIQYPDGSIFVERCGDDEASTWEHILPSGAHRRGYEDGRVIVEGGRGG